MKRNQTFVWQGLYYHTCEKLILTARADGYTAKGIIVGEAENLPVHFIYGLELSKDWRLLSASAEQVGSSEKLQLLRNTKGQWTNEKGKPYGLPDDCIDIDISITPFTNTLPINRMDFKKGEPKNITVIYINALSMKVSAMEQRYTLISKNRYRYESIPPGFTALLQTDEDGLVVKYPGLFERRYP
jgi:hypothetical protein